ncbi:MAG: hypothetical protein PBV01_11830 [Brucella anthropi]
MKVAAKINDNKYLVEMTSDEIARAAGYDSDWDSEFSKAIGYPARSNGLRTGTTIAVNAAYTFHRQISEHSDKAKSSASVLRALAEMLENGLPGVVLTPVEDKPKPEPAEGAAGAE